ncbi:SMAD/FHA domain-containing protein [Phanerochaete sordida]|uniref:SMAD/FHA domain-containing protein n=1 Tax=Phanerochaete sordida TaxID=48140 RepID=A0A9P3GMQ8_9APHY|nr:SMAD/FHA domain-containing protein [Phanerochaete sordida]
MLRRRRSAGALASQATPQVPVVAVARTAQPTSSAPPSAGSNVNHAGGPAHRIRLVPHLDSRRSLRFDPICRDVREGDAPLRIGRFTDRSGMGIAAANASGSNKLAFKSKVVSRAHAEIWAEQGGRFFIKDTKSSSGTFLNHVRLSPANTESRPSELKDGDLLQLGVDYQGGTEDIYKCVKIKIEVGREWQAHSNPFNTNALKQLKEIAIPKGPGAVGVLGASGKKSGNKTSLPDCCICLFSVTIQQALFIAPCSHAFHYKCIRPLLEAHQPAFSCPLCRTFANLDEDVEVEVEADEESIAEVNAVIASVTPATPVALGPNETSRERVDAGAETEVEPDMGSARLGPNLRRRAQPVPPLPHGDDLSGDVDMDDAAMLPALPEDADDIEFDVPGAARHRELSASPVPRTAAGRSTDLLFEVDGEASGSAEADAGASDSSAGGEAIINGKRKR